MLFVGTEEPRCTRRQMEATSRLYVHCSSSSVAWMWMFGASSACHHCNMHRGKDTSALCNTYLTMVEMQISAVQIRRPCYVVRQSAATKLFGYYLSAIWMLILGTRMAVLRYITRFSIIISKPIIPRSYDYYWNMAQTRTLGTTSTRPHYICCLRCSTQFHHRSSRPHASC